MNNLHFNAIRENPEFSLTQSERSAMRAALAALARTPRADAHHVPSPWFVFLMRPMPLAAFALILIIATGGVSFAAEGALPGDALYAVKVGVNEPLSTYFAPTPEAKADTQVRHAEERLKEIEVLAAKGPVDGAVTEGAERRIAKSVNGAVEAARTLATDGNAGAADAISARIAAALDAHSELLDAQSEGLDDGSKQSVRALASAVATVAGAAREETPVPEEQDGRGAVAAQARAEAALDALRDQLGEGGVPEETEAALSSELARLSDDFDSSVELLAAEDYANAAAGFAAVGKRAHRATVLLAAAQDIGASTEKEVVIDFGTDTTPAPARAAKAMTLFSAFATSSADQEEPDEEASIEEARGARLLEFRMRERSGD